MLTPEKVLRVVDPDSPRVYGLVCDAQDNLYNSGFSHGGDIYKYTNVGATVTSSVYGHDQIRWNRALACDAQGNLFANGIRLIDPRKPDVKKGPDGQWHLDRTNVQCGIFRIPKGGGQATLVVSLDDREESHPVGVVCADNGDIFSADYYISKDCPGVIYRNSPDGTYTIFASRLVSPMWLVMEPDPVVSAKQGVAP